MKKTTLLTLLILSFQLLYSQVYHVIHVKGTIQIKSTGEVLKPKDQINASETIIFWQ